MQGIFSTLVASSFCWFVASSLWIYPSSLSYFNELIGGPLNGHRHLLISNFDWGQDDLYIATAKSIWDSGGILDAGREVENADQHVRLWAVSLHPEGIHRLDRDSRKRLLELFETGTPLTYTQRLVDCGNIEQAWPSLTVCPP